MIIKFKLFEARFQDIYVSHDMNLDNYRNILFDSTDDFIDHVLIKSMNKKFNIMYNHNVVHDLKNRIKQRTNLKSIKEFNYLLRKALIELFLYEYNSNITSYSLYFIEYDFSVIINIKFDNNEIKMGTLLKGEDVCVGKKVNIISTL
jgi:hypothetical protein